MLRTQEIKTTYNRWFPVDFYTQNTYIMQGIWQLYMSERVGMDVDFLKRLSETELAGNLTNQ